MLGPVSQNQSNPQAEKAGLTHLDDQGRAHMVDVSGKPETLRTARAVARVRLTADVRDRLLAGNLPKGEALAVARVAGIQAAKETSRLIPLCHPLRIDQVEVRFQPEDTDIIRVEASTRTRGPTGVEMEALTAATVAALTIYDMVKAICRGASIERVALLSKDGGASGSWQVDGA
jgi:cyclic pyranopterin phosphate synthase